MRLGRAAVARRRTVAALVGLALLVAACGTTAPGATAPVPGDGGTTPPPPLDLGAPWRTTTLTDVRSGETFRVADLAGKLVVIETMAVWCTNCRIQQAEAAIALDELASDGIVFISAGVDPNERAEDLAAYGERNGFDWTFVVATPEFSRSLADSFGPQILSPPATPVIVVAPDGTVVDQHVGIRRAADLVTAWREHLPSGD